MTSNNSFQAKVQIIGVNPFIYVSAARAAAIQSGWRKPLPVLVRVNGEPPKRPWKTNMMPIRQGDFRLYLHGEMRRASNTRVGNSVRVQIQFNAAYRNGPQQPLPFWFRAALQQNARAKKGWDALPPSRKKEIVRYFSKLKSPQARIRNLQKATAVLSGKSIRFMGRLWLAKI